MYETPPADTNYSQAASGRFHVRQQVEGMDMRLQESDGQRLVALCDQVQSMHSSLEEHIWDLEDSDVFDGYDYGRKGHLSSNRNVRRN